MNKSTRTKARELREAEAAAERRRRVRTTWALGIGLALIVGLLTAIVVVAINSSQKANRDSNLDGPLVNPATMSAGGTIPVGEADAPVTLEIFLDYMCPSCKQFENANSAQLSQWIEDGAVRVELHPMNFLDSQSQGTMYSTRAANAVAAVADRTPDKVWEFNNALFAQQPQEGTPGLTDEQIAQLAVRSGVPQDVADSFTKGTFEPWVAASNASASEAGITGTPSVKINGQAFKGDLYSANSLAEAVRAEAGGAAAGGAAGDR